MTPRRRPLPVLPYVFISACLLGMAVHQAWPTSQESQQARPNLHTPAPVAGDLLPVVERLEKRVKKLESKSTPRPACGRDRNAVRATRDPNNSPSIASDGDRTSPCRPRLASNIQPL